MCEDFRDYLELAQNAEELDAGNTKAKMGSISIFTAKNGMEIVNGYSKADVDNWLNKRFL